MRRFSAVCVVSLVCCLQGCVWGVGWLPDSSGFVFTTAKGHLVAYDLATKKQRIILDDPAAAATSWPGVSRSGRIALAYLRALDDKEAILEIVVCNLQGQVEFRAAKFKMSTNKDFEYKTKLVWSPDEKKLLVACQWWSHQGGNHFCNSVLIDVATKDTQVWHLHAPAYFGGSPIRPDGTGFLLESPKNEIGEYVWVDWTGKKTIITASAKLKQLKEPFMPWPDFFDSHWDGDKAIVVAGSVNSRLGDITRPRLRYIIDTKMLQETVEDVRQADTIIGKEAIRTRAQLADGIELLVLEKDNDEKNGSALRVALRKKGDPILTEIVAPVRDRMVLLTVSPNRKHAIVRDAVDRGSQDTIYVINESGKVVDTIDVYGKYVKK